MQAIAISGSPREEGNTATLLRHCLARLSGLGISGQFHSLAGRTVSGCTACGQCRKRKDRTCRIQDDFQALFDAMLASDIIIVGSPTYFGSATPELMALLDRTGYVSRSNDNLLSRKLGGPVSVARRAGHNFTYAQLLMWFMINDMVVPGSTYWNVALALAPGSVRQDQEALATIERFADNLAWLASRVA